MKAVRGVVDYLVSGGVSYIFGIPAGSVNAFFDELYDVPEIEPVVAKHEGAASYMAAAYARATGHLGVCIGSSGPGSTNLLTGAANAAREHLPVLFLTGHVPVDAIGRNASQEFDSEAVYKPFVKYSVTVRRPEDLVDEVAKAVTIALSGVPGPVHVAMPIDVQLSKAEELPLPAFPRREKVLPDPEAVREAAVRLAQTPGVVFVGQGARRAIPEVIETAELLGWPIVVTPQAKGLIPESYPGYIGVYGFAGHEKAAEWVNDHPERALLIVGSSLGETATSNYSKPLGERQLIVQIDFDKTVFGRTYRCDVPLCGDADVTLQWLNRELRELGLSRHAQGTQPVALESVPSEFKTQNVLLALQRYLPQNTRYTVDIGEHMSYVIHYMRVLDYDSYEINVHFGPMGIAIGSAIGYALADPTRPVVCITGDGCFFMHGMEVLTAKEYRLPILFIVINNARLGMVHHGHLLQYHRAHPRFQQDPVNIAGMAAHLGVPALRVERFEDLADPRAENLLQADGPVVLDVALVDDQVPPMGDRVKFLSSFGR
ncbi:thiamine pyrophosphate-binding protein [Kyrpidia sp.]|uniref:thiamine pyrophosphate-binding protein n=1 Tax=Kyrpidia sp. TaxID=2073077 RepID=UPI0025832E3F|nr:thiamine pyrophosphate-binding protein [Kyrpidia sp.]MCL6575130.1 thiamine pyrophosphate-binding protein [Kyrpidia sp.]